MNKIERAIWDCKLKLENLRKERMILIGQINVLEDELSNLEAIERNKSIPHIETIDKSIQSYTEETLPKINQ